MRINIQKKRRIGPILRFFTSGYHNSNKKIGPILHFFKHENQNKQKKQNCTNSAFFETGIKIKKAELHQFFIFSQMAINIQQKTELD